LIYWWLDPIHTYFDEIVVVDTGSKDKTKELLEGYGAKVIDLRWKEGEEDFGKARNIGLQELSTDWVLQLDPDEQIVALDFQHLGEMIQEKEVDAYLFPVVNYQIDGKPSLTETFRLFRNSKEIRYEGLCHESVEESLQKQKDKIKIARVNFPIHHKGYLQGDVYVEKKLELYKRLCEKQIMLTPKSAKPYFSLGLHYLNDSKGDDGKWEYGMQLLEKSIRLNPDFFQPRKEIAFEYLRLGLQHLVVAGKSMPESHPMKGMIAKTVEFLKQLVGERFVVGRASERFLKFKKEESEARRGCSLL